MTEDTINPAHYKTEVGECIDAMRAISSEAEFRAHCRLTAFKYLWRAKNKGEEIENYRKAIWYLTFATGVDPREEDDGN